MELSVYDRLLKFREKKKLSAIEEWVSELNSKTYQTCDTSYNHWVIDVLCACARIANDMQHMLWPLDTHTHTHTRHSFIHIENIYAERDIQEAEQFVSISFEEKKKKKKKKLNKNQIC